MCPNHRLNKQVDEEGVIDKFLRRLGAAPGGSFDSGDGYGLKRRSGASTAARSFGRGRAGAGRAQPGEQVAAKMASTDDGGTGWALAQVRPSSGADRSRSGGAVAAS